MNKRILIPVIMAILTTLLSGCATISTQYNFRNPPPRYPDIFHMIEIEKIPIIYSGAYVDVHDLILIPFTAHGESGLVAIPFFPIMIIIGLIDLPFSFALDTLILPYTIPYSRSLDREKKARIAAEKEQRRKENEPIYEFDTGGEIKNRAITPHKEDR